MRMSAESRSREDAPADSTMAEAAGEQRSADATGAGHTGAAAGRVPDFFIIGHEKCGTTALYRLLSGHPQIYMPELKEPRFFATDLVGRNPGQGAGTRPRTLEGYLALFAPAGPEQRAGEASPQYIRSTEAARLIAEIQPAARIIAILREPVSFLQTFHLQCVRAGVEPQRDLRKALALEPLRREGKRLPRALHSAQRLLYSEHVRYVEQLRRFHAVFPADQVMVLIYEDFRRDNAAAARRVLRFLEVDDTAPLDVREAPSSVRANAVRSRALRRLTLEIRTARRRPAAAGRAARLIDSLTPRQLRSDAFEDVLRRIVFMRPRPLDEDFLLELRRRFKGEVEALSEYLGRDLVSFWGYDDLG
jgi:hypothetical protein